MAGKNIKPINKNIKPTSKNVKPTKKSDQSQFDRQVRRNQIIFGVIAVILVLSMALSLVVTI